MDFVRTPDSRFVGLPDYPFAANYAQVPDTEGGELRLHYLDEGPSTGRPVLLFHGEPSWSYLYRRVIPPLAAAGMRVVVPDLVGFGKSDKPTQRGDYTYSRHISWMSSLVFDVLGLDGICLFAQDWGGLIGLRMVTASPHRFAKVAVGNTGLPTGDAPLSPAFLAWREFSQKTPDFDVGRIVDGGCTTALPAAVIAAYDAPFPDDSYKAGARVFPLLVPTFPDDSERDNNLAAWRALEAFERPFLLTFSDSDQITAGNDAPFRARVPGAAGQPHTTIEGAGHFLQEDRGPELAEVLVGFFGD